MSCSEIVWSDAFDNLLKLTRYVYTSRDFAEGFVYSMAFVPYADANGNMRCCHIRFEFHRYPPYYFCTARYEYESLQNKTNFEKMNKKINSWPDFGGKLA